MRLDDLLTQIRTYAETHAKAQSCRATAGHSTVPADRSNLNARADFWTQEAAGQYAAITNLLAAEMASTIYATPDTFMPVRLPGPDLRHVELRGMFSDGDRTVTQHLRPHPGGHRRHAHDRPRRHRQRPHRRTHRRPRTLDAHRCAELTAPHLPPGPRGHR